MSGATPTRGNEEHVAVQREADFRSWLMLMMSLTATVSYAAGLAPPGGCWGQDDASNGYIAGNPVMRDKSPRRYLAFYYSNTSAFFSSLSVIAMLSKHDKSRLQRNIFGLAVVICLLSLCASYLAGTAVDTKSIIVSVVYIAACLASTPMITVTKQTWKALTHL